MQNSVEQQSAHGARRYLVLGGHGFIGSHLTRVLLSHGHKVRCFDRRQCARAVGATWPNQDNYEFLAGDFTNQDDLARALDDIDVCFHLVSTTLPKSSNADPAFDVESNILGSIRLLAEAARASLAKVVFVSSGGTVYGVPEATPITESHSTDPVCSYGIAKLAIEKYLELFRVEQGLEYTILRLANPYGEGQPIEASQGAIAVFLGKLLRGEPVEVWGDGSVVRDYIHIDDVVQALLLAVDHRGPERLFNIGSGQGRSINEVLDALERVVGRQAERRYLPGRSFDVPVSVLSIERAQRRLGWSPRVDFDEGVRRFAAWTQSALAETEPPHEPAKYGVASR